MSEVITTISHVTVVCADELIISVSVVIVSTSVGSYGVLSQHDEKPPSPLNAVDTMRCVASFSFKVEIAFLIILVL